MAKGKETEIKLVDPHAAQIYEALTAIHRYALFCVSCYSMGDRDGAKTHAMHVLDFAYVLTRAIPDRFPPSETQEDETPPDIGKGEFPF